MLAPHLFNSAPTSTSTLTWRSAVSALMWAFFLPLPTAVSAQQSPWCNNQSRPAGCDTLPCDEAAVAPLSASCVWGTYRVGDVVIHTGFPSPLYGKRGTVVCASTGDTLLILWEYHTGGSQGDDAATFCSSCADPYPILTNGSNAVWVECNAISPDCAQPCTPAPTAPPTPWPPTTQDAKQLVLGWSTSLLWPDTPTSTVGTAGAPNVFLQENIGPIGVQVLLEGVTGPDALQRQPEVYCTLDLDNAVVSGATDNIRVSNGAAIFDPILLMELASGATSTTATVKCSLGLAGVQYNFSSDTISAGVGVNPARNATTAPATPEPPVIPPEDRIWNFIGQGNATVHPWEVPYARSPVDGLPPSGNWSTVPECDRNPDFCPYDCQITGWSAWSSCNSSCGSHGAQSRFRTVLSPERYGGTPCSDYTLYESSPCNRFSCSEVCLREIAGEGSTSGSPGGWTCGTYAAIKSGQLYGGGMGAASVLPGCAALKPGVAAGAVFPFEGNVSLEVGDAIQIGVRAGSLGSSCNLMTSRPCVRIVADVSNNGGGPWTRCGTFDHIDHLGMEWRGGATAAVQCTSPHRATRLYLRLSAIEVSSSGSLGSGAITGGQAVPSTWGNRNDVQGNGNPSGGYFGSGQYATVFLTQVGVHIPCVRGCELSGWGPWEACSNPCGGGRQRRERLVVTAASRGGEPCGPTAESRECNTHHCDSDCVFTNYTSFSECSLTCGGGTQSRFREILSHPAGSGGAPCPPLLVDSQPCNTHPCWGDCQITAFTLWGPCVAGSGCGAGISQRTRTIVTRASGAGEPCPHLTESRPCDAGDCPATPEAGGGGGGGGGGGSGTPSPPEASPPPTWAATLSPMSPEVTLPPPSRPAATRFSIRPSPADAAGFPPPDPLPAFVVGVNPISLREISAALPDGVTLSARATLLDTTMGLTLGGTVEVRISSLGTAAFTDLSFRRAGGGTSGRDAGVLQQGDDASNSSSEGIRRVVDIALTLGLNPEVPGVDLGSPVLRRYTVDPGMGAGGGGGGGVAGSSPSPARFISAGYAAPLGDFSVDSWVASVEPLLPLSEGQSLRAVAVGDAARVSPTSDFPSPLLHGTALCPGGGPTSPAGASILFSVVPEDPGRAVEAAFLKGSLDPDSPLSKISCGVAYAFAGASDDSHMQPFLAAAQMGQTESPKESDGGNTSDVNWGLIAGVLVPTTLLIWAAVGVALYLSSRAKGSRGGAAKPPPEADGGSDVGRGAGGGGGGLEEASPRSSAGLVSPVPGGGEMEGVNPIDAAFPQQV